MLNIKDILKSDTHDKKTRHTYLEDTLKRGDRKEKCGRMGVRVNVLAFSMKKSSYLIFMNEECQQLLIVKVIN